MPRPLEVRVRPMMEGGVGVGSTASFACDALPGRGDTVRRFSWQAAVQIANETRYRYDDDRRNIVHITSVQGKDNNTDVVCEVLTASGRKGKGTAKILVEAQGVQSTPIAGPRSPDYLTPTQRSVGMQSPLTNARNNCIILGAALGGVVLILLLLMAIKLSNYLTSRQELKRLARESGQAKMEKDLTEWYLPAPAVMEGVQTYATLGETLSSLYEDMRPSAILKKGCSASLPTKFGFEPKTLLGSGVSMTSDYGTYENLNWGVSLPHPSPGWNRPGCSSSLPVQHTYPSLGTASSCHSIIESHDGDNVYSSPRLSEQTRNTYENVRAAEHEYENCRRDSEDSEITYVDLDFGDTDHACTVEPTSIEPTDIDSDSIEYSKVLQILSVFRSRSGSTTVKVIETENNDSSE